MLAQLINRLQRFFDDEPNVVAHIILQFIHEMFDNDLIRPALLPVTAYQKQSGATLYDSGDLQNAVEILDDNNAKLIGVFDDNVPRSSRIDRRYEWPWGIRPLPQPNYENPMPQWPTVSNGVLAGMHELGYDAEINLPFHGTVDLPKRPFLAPAVDNNLDEIINTIVDDFIASVRI